MTVPTNRLARSSCSQTHSLRRSRTREMDTLDSISLLRRHWTSLIKNAHIHEPDSVDRTVSTVLGGCACRDFPCARTPTACGPKTEEFEPRSRARWHTPGNCQIALI